MVNAAIGFPLLNPVLFITQLIRASTFSCNRNEKLKNYMTMEEEQG